MLLAQLQAFKAAMLADATVAPLISAGNHGATVTYYNTIPGSPAEGKSFSVSNGYGFLPLFVRIKNDLGVSLSTDTLATIEISSTSA